MEEVPLSQIQHAAGLAAQGENARADSVQADDRELGAVGGASHDASVVQVDEGMKEIIDDLLAK